MCVGVEVGVRGPGVSVHTGQAGGDLHLLIAGVSSLTSLGQQTVGELQRQPAIMILIATCQAQVQPQNKFPQKNKGIWKTDGRWKREMGEI